METEAALARASEAIIVAVLRAERHARAGRSVLSEVSVIAGARRDLRSRELRSLVDDLVITYAACQAPVLRDDDADRARVDLAFSIDALREAVGPANGDIGRPASG